MFAKIKSLFEKPDFGKLLIRIGFGITFIALGIPKLAGGVDKWTGIGAAMAKIGLPLEAFYPAFGLAAALAEFLGGIAILIGFGFRTACFFLCFTMIVAAATQVGGDPWFQVLWPASMAFYFLGAMFMGPGSISVQKG
ncbi:MAG: DoxX family protein [Opitutales bacterium]